MPTAKRKPRAKPARRPRIKGRYYAPKAGEWIQPIMQHYRFGCCDCGLVHRIDFRIRGRKVQFRVFRDNRSTAAIRRRRHDFVKRKDKG